MVDEVSEDGGHGVIAQRLEHLFSTVFPKELGRPYTLREAAAKINSDAGESVISPAYIAQLRNGDRAEPAFSKLVGLAKLFGVTVDYFTDDDAAQRIDDQLALVAAMRDQGVEHVALRAAGLSADSLKAVLNLMDSARKLEGLPAVEEQTPSGQE
jgi:transcriptional regulator with XRE-family HTH domain